MKSAFVLMIFILIASILVWFVDEPAPQVPEGESKEMYDVSLFSKAVFVYDDISVPVDTKMLDLSGKGLEGSLKAEVRQLTELRELNLSNNNFTGLPAEVGQLSKLEILNLSNNPFTGLPYELGDLSNLKILDLRGTDYSEVDLDVIKNELPAEAEILIDKSN